MNDKEAPLRCDTCVSRHCCSDRLELMHVQRACNTTFRSMAQEITGHNLLHIKFPLVELDCVHYVQETENEKT